jgi:hypothetical protein
VKRPELIVYLGPSPDHQDPALALRARATLALKVRGRRWTWRCPFCGSEAQGKLQPGLQDICLPHEEWCPVLLDSDLG